MRLSLFSRVLPVLAFPLCLMLSSCTREQRVTTKFQMGENATVGPFSYVVVESTWAQQLGSGIEARTPKNRFLMLTVSATNRGSAAMPIPLLMLRGPDGTEYQELTEGAGVNDWLGIIRNIGPAKTIQGRILFDAPLANYELRLPDGGESGYEKYAWVSVPLGLESNQVQSPVTGQK